jgi:hypothetical protein
MTMSMRTPTVTMSTSTSHMAPIRMTETGTAPTSLATTATSTRMIISTGQG